MLEEHEDTETIKHQASAAIWKSGWRWSEGDGEDESECDEIGTFIWSNF